MDGWMEEMDRQREERIILCAPGACHLCTFSCCFSGHGFGILELRALGGGSGLQDLGSGLLGPGSWALGLLGSRLWEPGLSGFRL